MIIMFKYIEKSHFNVFNNDALFKLLENRNIIDKKEFIKPTEKSLEPVCNFQMMESAEKLLHTTIEHNYKITILFDCDIDGYTSGSIMYQVLFNLNCNVDYILHDKKQHGLDKNTMEIIYQKKPRLLIIPDAGSSDYEQINELLDNNINVLILDHHELANGINLQFYPKEIYNMCTDSISVIINNQLEECVKDKAMTGVGITYKFVEYLEQMGYKVRAKDYLDLVALGMIGDVFDATQLQSRYLVFQGIEQINCKFNKNKFIKYLFNKKNIDNKCDMIIIAFNFVPLLNALIRFGTMEEKECLVRALNNSDEVITTKIIGRGICNISIQEYVFRTCEHYKNKQKEETNKATKSLEKQISQYKLNNNPVIVCNSSNINEAITGLVAIKISSKYNKPCLLLHDNKEDKINKYYSGSGRGNNNGKIKKLKNFLEETNLFDELAGHQNAFGVKIQQDKIPLLFEYFKNTELSTEIEPTQIDSVLNIDFINSFFINQLLNYQYLWGCGVHEPKFVTTFELDVNSVKQCGDGSSIQFYKNKIKYCYFNVPQGTLETILNSNKSLKCEFLIKFNKNSFLGRIENQVIIEDINILI